MKEFEPVKGFTFAPFAHVWPEEKRAFACAPRQGRMSSRSRLRPGPPKGRGGAPSAGMGCAPEAAAGIDRAAALTGRFPPG